jgi:hypothetical protein
MSNLLKEAIVDAQALREAALKSAESSIIEKYSNEVRNTLDKLLEQEEEPPAEEDLAADLLGGAEGGADPLAGLDPMAAAGPPLGGEGEAVQEVAVDVPLGAAEGEKLCACPDEGQVAEVSVNLDELREAVEALKTEAEDSEEIDISDVISELLDEGDIAYSRNIPSEPKSPEDWEITGGESKGDDETAKDPAAGETDEEEMTGAGLEETIELSEDDIESLVEKLVVDMGAELSGWAGRSAYDVKWQMEKEMAHRRTTEVAEDFEDLKKAQKELVFENNQLTETLSQYKQATQELKENLHDVNLSNARLLYTNRVLRNTSLNERQKDKIADAISKAGSVREAKTIYETLQSTVESTPKRGPQSLSEVINRPSSIIRATRKEKHTSDPATERMKKLAGII